MIKPHQTIKGFFIGLLLAGTASIAATALPIYRGSCGGSCAGCGACGFTVVPLVIWLASKRWGWAVRIRNRFATRSCAADISSPQVHFGRKN